MCSDKGKMQDEIRDATLELGKNSRFGSGPFAPLPASHYKQPSVKTTHQEKLWKLFLTWKCITMSITCCTCQRKVEAKEVSLSIIHNYLQFFALTGSNFINYIYMFMYRDQVHFRESESDNFSFSSTLE